MASVLGRSAAPAGGKVSALKRCGQKCGVESAVSKEKRGDLGRVYKVMHASCYVYISGFRRSSHSGCHVLSKQCSSFPSF